MLNWLKRKRNDPSPDAPKANTGANLLQSAPAPRGIAFDPDLIRKLKDDHGQLLQLYREIQTAAKAGQWATVETALNRFQMELTDHLMIESIKLYVYLQRSLAGDRDSLVLMRGFSTEMVGIGKTVLDFINANKGIRADRIKQESFVETWDQIGQALSDRIAREERTLYQMYQAEDIT